MAGSITHSTVAVGADDPTKEINKAQWNDNHTFSGIAYLSGSTFDDTAIPFASGTDGKLATDNGLVFDPAWSGVGSSAPGPTVLLTDISFQSSVDRTHASGTFANLLSDLNYTPSGSDGTNSATAAKSKLEIAGANAFAHGTAHDTYAAHGGTGGYVAIIGESHIAETYGDSDGTAGIVGASFTAIQRGTSGTPSVPAIICAQIDGEDGGTRILRGTVSSYYRGLNIIDLNTDGNGSNAPTVAEREAIYIGTMAGSATADWSIYNAATQNNYFAGNLGLNVTPTARLHLSGTASGTYTPAATGVANSTDHAVKSALTSAAANNTVSGSISELTHALTSNPASAYTMQGSFSIAVTLTADTAVYPTTSALVGSSAIAAVAGSGTVPIVAAMSGVAIRSAHASTGTTIGTRFVGGQFQILNLENSGTIPITAGMYVLRPLGTASSTITVQAGLYLERQDPASGTTTDAYGIYQAGTAEKNYLGSGLWIGAATGARATTQPTNHINLFDGTAPAGALTNGVTVYSGSGKLKTCDAAGLVAHIVAASATNSVSPTSPNRTLTVDVGGTTLYIHCKTTND